MQEFEAIFYDLPDGREPAREFLDSLDVKMRAKMVRTIELLQHNGTSLREPYSKALEDGVGHRIVLTNGFIKKTQKTPPEEIERAKAYRREYLDRKENRP